MTKCILDDKAVALLKDLIGGGDTPVLEDIEVTPTTAAGTVVRTQVDVSSLNISECISIDAMIKSSSINQTTKAPAVSTTGETNGALCCVYKIQDKLIEFQNSAWTSALETITGTVTIKYTKTT